MYTYCVLPARIAFGGTRAEVFFYVDLILDIVFLVDIVLNFCTGELALLEASLSAFLRLHRKGRSRDGLQGSQEQIPSHLLLRRPLLCLPHRSPLFLNHYVSHTHPIGMD